ncbi:MAG: response regulator, partial [Actinomycetota bacterium]|nr:response regulator [Actinomycetota bacterium]
SRVLVVDDEPDVLLLCRLNLQQRGHELLEASTGSLALELARKRHPDVIVLDLMLPGMTGYEVLETLKGDEQTSGIPVLVLTAKSLRADRERSHGLGASGFLTKPFLPSELCELVESLVPTIGRR